MTQPGAPVGEVRAELVITTDKTPEQVHRELEEVAAVVDDDMGDIGESGGKEFDQGLKKSTKNTGRDVARQVSAGIEREGIRLIPTKVTTQLDSNNNVIRRWVTETAEDVVREVQRASDGGAFNKVGETFTTAIGAGFNVSGRSPLIALLIPLIGIIGELIGGLIQGVGALSSLLFIVPSLIGAIGAQVGVLVIAFNGLGEAIKGAFEAKTPEELNEALKNLTPSAQEFVKSLLPLREVWGGLRNVIQEGFFSKFGTVLAQVFGPGSPLTSTLAFTLDGLARSLGSALNLLLQFFGSPVFIQFLNVLIPATSKWVTLFSIALYDLLGAFAELGIAVQPFLDWFGGIFNAAILEFAGWIRELSHDQGFLDWLEEVKGDLAVLWSVFQAAGAFIFSFIKNLDEAGGDNLLSSLADQLAMLAGFFDSDVGRKALEGLINGLIILSNAFTGLVIIIGSFIALLQFLAEVISFYFSAEGFQAVGEDIMGFFSMIGQAIKDFFYSIGETVVNFVTQTLPKALSDVGNAAATALTTAFNFIVSLGAYIAQAIYNFGGSIAQFFRDQANAVWGFVVNIKNAIVNFASDAWNWLYNAGRNVVSGLIEGIKSMLGPLGGIMGTVASKIGGFLPHSPAKEGPLSGSGDPLLSGQAIVNRLVAGIEMQGPELSNAMANATSNVNVGSGAVQLNFYGPTPSTGQANAVGTAAGNALAGALAQRQAQLAVRMLTGAI